MKISLCIPQYNRIKYLLKNLSIIAQQSYNDIEIVIADDASTDTTEEEITRFIQAYRYPVIYYRHPVNVGYDTNLRKSFELATGDYCIAMGNDDTLKGAEGIERLVDFLKVYDRPEIGFCNYAEDHSPDVPIVRASSSQVVGSGLEIALKYYRSFSFVGGIILRKDSFDAVNTNKVDGSVYVQMYFAARIITNGGRLFMYEPSLILKDIHLEGSMANSYRDTLMKNWKDLKPIDGGLKQVIRAVLEGFKDAGVNIGQVSYKVIKNIYQFTYPFWLLDYRSNNSFVGAVGMMQGLKPSGIPQLQYLSLSEKFKIKSYYYFSTIIGFLLPVFIFNKFKNQVYKRIKS
jgi:glycosyltransferase involved in cell wall biosynthesis